MKAKRFFILLLISLLLVGCGQNTTQNYATTDYTDYQDVETLLRLPLTKDLVVPVGTYVSDNEKVTATVELPNETNTQNLDIIRASFQTTSLQLTDKKCFWKICIYSNGYYPIQLVVEDYNYTGASKRKQKQLEQAIIKRASANRVTTIYNTTPWPKGNYLVQFDGATPDKSFYSIQTGSSLDELGLST